MEMQNMRAFTHSSKVALRIGGGGGGIQLLQVVCTVTEKQQGNQRE